MKKTKDKVLANDSGVQHWMEKPWQVVVLRDINCPEGNKKKQELKEEVEMYGSAKKCTNKNEL